MSVLTQFVARLLLAPVLVVAVAIVVKGYADVGDGFAAGVVAALGVLLQYVGFGYETVHRTLPVRGAEGLAFAGLGLALVVALVPLLRGDPILTQLPAPGDDVIYLGTIELITAFAFDLGVFALVLGAVVGILDRVAGTPRDVEEL